MSEPAPERIEPYYDDRQVARIERIPASRAAAICGITRRTLYGWSQDGKVPGAAKLNGVWRYDERKLRRWIAERERKACRGTSTDAETLGGDASKFAGRTFDEAYERLFSPRPKSG